MSEIFGNKTQNLGIDASNLDSMFNDQLTTKKFNLPYAEKDSCKVFQILKSNSPKLLDAKEREVRVVKYIFEEQFKSFHILYSNETTKPKANVEKIICKKQDNIKKCVDFVADGENLIEGHWEDDVIHIDLVYIRKEGSCSKAVGYLLKGFMKLQKLMTTHILERFTSIKY